MATITAGTGSTISATTIEGQLFQLCHYINSLETNTSGGENKFSLDKSEDGVLSSSFTLQGQLTYASATGLFTESPLPYYSTATFNAGNPLGTIKSTTLSGYFLDCCLYALVWQRNRAKNPQQVTGVTLDFDFTEGVYSGSLSLPYSTTLGSGGIVTETATEWLLT